MLTSKERAELRSQATTLDTTLMVGKGGVTENRKIELSAPGCSCCVSGDFDGDGKGYTHHQSR